jgi:FSR family fosmidomycin resistance protein-like MFS transporter
MVYTGCNLTRGNVLKSSVLTLLFLALAHCLVDFQIGIFAVYKTMVGLDLAKAGIIGLIAALIGEGCQAFFGPLSDSGYRRFIILCGMLMVCASSFMAYTTDYFILQIFLLLTFLGSGAFHPAAAGLVATLSRTRRGLFFTVFAAGGALGLAVSQISFYHTFQYFNGHTAILALPTGLLVLICMFLPFGREQTKRKSVPFSAILKLFQRTDMRRLYCVQVCNQSFYWATMFLLPDALTAMGCEEWICFGGGHMALILGGAIMMIPGGLLSDRYSPKSVIIGAMIMSFLLFYVWVGVGSISPLWTLSLLFAMGAVFNVVAPVGLALGHRYLPDQPSMVSAFVMGMVWCVAESIGPASGILTKFFPYGNAPLQALMVVSSLSILGLWAAFRLPVDQEFTEAETIPA